MVVLFNPSRGIKGVHTFPKGFSPNVNIIVGKFRLQACYVAVQYISHYATSLFR